MKTLNAALVSPLEKATLNGLNPKPGATLIVCSQAQSKKLAKELSGVVARWQLDELKDDKKSSFSFSTDEGPLWVLRPDSLKSPKAHFAWNDFAKAREVLGPWCRSHLSDIEVLSLDFRGLKSEALKGALHALILAHYKPSLLYKTSDKSKKPIKFFVKSDKTKITPKFIKEVQALSGSMNISRHLTNMPGADLHPKSFAEIAKKLLSKKKSVTVEVWNTQRLEKEKCGLLLGVGRSGVTPPCLIRIKYRPSGKTKKPIAFVGKGVTFDTGGLDLKPAQYMRHMKKDMSGAGVVLGLAHFVAETQPQRPFDFYLAVAENGVNENAVRPGDVLTSRNGKTIEIHNTDAEGRLVLADAMDVAINQKGNNAPEALIDVSTLTGAMRVALGFDVAGFFANDEKLASELEKSSQNMGEPAWRMPLYQAYKSDLKSSIADMTNCGSSGMGGAISAALFLKEFIGNTKWAHFDVMAFNNSAKGALSEGGNAQSFQILADYISRA